MWSRRHFANTTGRTMFEIVWGRYDVEETDSSASPILYVHWSRKRRGEKGKEKIM